MLYIIKHYIKLYIDKNILSNKDWGMKIDIDFVNVLDEIKGDGEINKFINFYALYIKGINKGDSNFVKKIIAEKIKNLYKYILDKLY